MKGEYEIKMDVLGPEPGQEKEVKILSRVIRWTEEGLEYEADQRHADLLIKEMGVEKGKSAVTPCIAQTLSQNEVNEKTKGEEETLTGMEVTRYRSIAARVN